MTRDQANVFANRIAEIFNKRDIGSFIYVEPVEPGHEQATDLHTISIKLGESGGRVVDMLEFFHRSVP